jgi:glycosyltransferase involved in cell wall biosynthesis
MSAGNFAKVLFVVISTSGGGAENSMMAITSELRKKGFDFQLCAINGDKTSLDLLSEKDGISILGRRWDGGISDTAKTLFDFKKLVRDLHPEVVIANCELPELFVAITPLSKSRIAIVEHTTNPWAGRKVMGMTVRTILKLRKVYWVTVSSDAKPIWFGSRKPHYIANPISVAKNSPSSNIREQSAVFIGRLRAEKRPDWLISSAVKAGLSVDIFGDGNQSEILREKYSKLYSQVRFHGFVTNPWGQLGENSIVVVPSEYEGDGMVVAEAILRGYAVLLADNPDLRRFGLPDVNYFLNKAELEAKLKSWKESESQDFRIPDAITKSLYVARDMKTIVEQWEILVTKLQK